jgi:hypothetical protein
MVNRKDALSHDDTKDREVAKQFLEENNWYDIQMGGKWDLDLEVNEFKRGCDVEMISYGMDRIKQYNHFRIPVRKQKYWNNSDTYTAKDNSVWTNKYKGWYVDYIQFLNNNLDELLWYDYKLIKEYINNQYTANSLKKEWIIESERTFITIPYEIGIGRIKHFKLINGIWESKIK